MRWWCTLTMLFACIHSISADEGIVVVGTAELKLPPETAFVTLYIEGQGMLVTDAVKVADKRLSEVLAAVEGEFKDLQAVEVMELFIGDVDDMGWEPGTAAVPKPKVAKRIRITMAPDAAKVHQLLDVAMRAGALLKSSSSRSYGETSSAVLYGLLDTPELRKKLEEAAVADAKASAGRIAELTGHSVKGISAANGGSGRAESIAFQMLEDHEGFPTPFLGTDSKAVEATYALSLTFALETVPQP